MLEARRAAGRTLSLDGFRSALQRSTGDEAHAVLVQLELGQSSEFRALCRERGIQLHDSIDWQLLEWAETELPAADDATRRSLVVQEAGPEGSRSDYGRWAWYPWRNIVAHLLPPDRFFAVRTNRNRDKITEEEQTLLRRKRIGVIGLSVGHASALVLAQEGICGELRIADYDRISLSNLNRLKTSLLNIGQTKVRVAAREIAEIDPYLDVKLFEDGVTDTNIEAFFEDGGMLDLVVEECDSLPIKLRVRELARANGIPVVMDTNDRGTLDVELFDRDPGRPLLHGLMGDADGDNTRHVEAIDKYRLFLSFFGGEQNLSPRFRDSLKRIGKELVGFPQLASDTQLGGSLVAHASRRVLLGDLKKSGRFRVELDALIGDDSEAVASMGATLSDVDVETLATAGGAAPSGGNVQAWRARFDGNQLELRLDAERSDSFLDVGRRASLFSLGSFAENVAIAARALGLEHEEELLPWSRVEDPVARFSFTGRRSAPPAEIDPDLRLVHQRCTNRQIGERDLAPRHVIAAMEQATAAAWEGAGLVSVHSEDDKREAARILGKADEIRFYHPVLHGQLMEEIRWNDEEAKRTRDGVDVATLEAPPEGLRDLSAMRSHDHVLKFMTPEIIHRMSALPLIACSHICCVTGPAELDAHSLFGLGRATQRAWLEATRHGLSVQPWSVLTFFLMRLHDAGGDGFTDEQKADLTQLGVDLKQLFGLPEGRRPVFLFRISTAEPPTARALRRDWHDYTERIS